MSLEGLPVREQERLHGKLDPKVDGEPNMSDADDYLRLQQLREETRQLEQRLSRKQNHSPLTALDEAKMRSWQAKCDVAFQAFNQRAPEPRILERPGEYLRRVLGLLQPSSERWRTADLSGVDDDALERVIGPQIVEDTLAFAKSPLSVRPGETREVVRNDSGHEVREFFGHTHFVKNFARRPRKAILRSREAYLEMARDAQLFKLSERGIRP